MFTKTTAVTKILNLKKRLKIIQGGSSAGKTIATLLILTDIAQSQKGKLISVVSETIPHLKRGAIRDFLAIMHQHNYYKESQWNRTDYIYTFETGCQVEFFSADNEKRVRGPRRDILFLNEANNVRYETYTQLAIRTNESIYIDYNPVNEFWVHEDVIPNLEHDFIILTYKDNEGLPESIVKELESRKHNKNWWQVYGLGQLGEIESRIFTGWNIVDRIPEDARLEKYGLDFGYTNDPSAIVAVYYYNDGYILDQITFQNGLSNRQIADILKGKDRATVVADSAEPKSIDEIKGFGFPIVPSVKGAGSVLQGIQFVQEQNISVTKRSLDVIKEYRNYVWMTDKNGKIINEPEHTYSHSMDAIRYAFSIRKRTPSISWV